jgi:phosphatidylserine/phosphatidylglycerophosphate/cardiolipin synthase-like enzyme
MKVPAAGNNAEGVGSMDGMADGLAGIDLEATDGGSIDVPDSPFDTAFDSGVAIPDSVGLDGGADVLTVEVKDTSAGKDAAGPDTMDPDSAGDVATPKECGWDGSDTAQSALLKIHVVDSWGQPLTDASSVLWGPAGQGLSQGGEELVEIPLCGPVNLNLTVAAKYFHAHQGVITYDGGAGGDSLLVYGDPKRVSWVLSLDYEAGIPRYTLHLGLSHRYFAASGPPARKGNTVTFYLSPSEALEAFYVEALQTAWELVTISTWWWVSDFELIRGSPVPPFMSKAERWPYTALGLIENLKPFDVNVKVLVNQFLSQDGFFADVNVDDALMDAMDDGLVEYLGHFNDADGVFTATIPETNLQERLEANGGLGKGLVLTKLNMAPPIGPQTVDMTAVPLGLGALNFPHASWHQKFFTIDQKVAYIGGVNFDVLDWDTPDMLVFDPRRMAFDASSSAREDVFNKEEASDYPNRRDYMLRAEGPVVVDAMEVFHTRWHDQKDAGVQYADKATAFDLVSAPGPQNGGVTAQVVTTMPAPYHRYEIMDTLLRAISQAEDYILIEDQYFRAPILADAIESRLLEAPELVVIAVINPISEWIDPGCWQTLIELNQLKDAASGRFGVFSLRSFDAYDSGCFVCFDEVVGVYMPTFIHSKLVMIDDVYFQMGSANHNNRGLVFEGEMATVVVDDGWVKDARDAVAKALLGPTYNPATKGLGLLQQFKAQADWNDYVVENWDDEGYDINLNGDPLPIEYTPEGFVYPIEFNAPDECLIEGVGADIM